MSTTFLLGPAGSGKTFRCLAEIRTELLRSPEGPPLVLLAPKQATFQLERQLLDPAQTTLQGYTRLHIRSFDRLAQFVLDQLRRPLPKLLNEEGRVMVLRALLMQRHAELKVFRASARLPGFASHLSQLLRELQRHHLSVERLNALAGKSDLPAPLRDKLHDVALLLRAYLDWLNSHELEDADSLLDFATRQLRSAPRNPQTEMRIAGLWLDGFAEMTPQEVEFLATLVPCCDRATLAFCLEAVPQAGTSWLSAWAVVGETFRRCHGALSALPNLTVSLEQLRRDAAKGRFATSVPLRHLEAHWSQPGPFAPETEGEVDLASGIQLLACADAESEAIAAAREILRHVRGGGRFRDCAVIVRSLDGYHVALRRAFRRYGIPFFLDRREPAAHHPLAELTRYALRTVAYGWRHDDWFAALKTGLAGAGDSAVDELENEALKRGWQGEAWLRALSSREGEARPSFFEQVRARVVPPFVDLRDALGASPTGAQLALALRAFWTELEIEKQLQRWTDEAPESAIPNPQSAIHETVWHQLNRWLANLELGFPDEAGARPLREWLPILEAGLGNLTVGIIPPALDQVLIGAIDRSRNPDLQLAIVLGLNEGIFPAPPSASPLLTESEREKLDALDAHLSFSPRLRHGHERFLGYIACTRSRGRLLLTCAARDADGKELNPSPLLTHVLSLVPSLKLEPAPRLDLGLALHPCEVVAPLIALQSSERGTRNAEVVKLAALDCFREPLAKAAQLRSALARETLSANTVEKLFGKTLDTSVSALEDYAECPFRFLAARGLRAQEREELVVDSRRLGTFMHEVMKEFHLETLRRGRRWRDWEASEAAAEMERLGAALMGREGGQNFKGAFTQSAAARFSGEVQISQLKRLIKVLVTWARHNDFEPRAVEVGFGVDAGQLPPWELALPGSHRLRLHGRVDRVDVCCDPASGKAWAAVLDYKSRARSFDAVLVFNGLELQLLAYLGALAALRNPQPLFGVKKLEPAGVFYVPLRGGRTGRGNSRTEILAGRETALRAFQHTGRFSLEVLRLLDTRRGAKKGEQFRFSFNKDGFLSKTGNDALTAGEFQALLRNVEEKLKEFGVAIFNGQFAVAPFRRGVKTACDYCPHQPVCRFDPWTNDYRALKQPPEKAATAAEAG
jgi:ATP-dependent helicase/nuclease subunit B